MDAIGLVSDVLLPYQPRAQAAARAQAFHPQPDALQDVGGEEVGPSSRGEVGRERTDERTGRTEAAVVQRASEEVVGPTGQQRWVRDDQLEDVLAGQPVAAVGPRRSSRRSRQRRPRRVLRSPRRPPTSPNQAAHSASSTPRSTATAVSTRSSTRRRRRAASRASTYRTRTSSTDFT